MVLHEIFSALVRICSNQYFLVLKYIPFLYHPVKYSTPDIHSHLDLENMTFPGNKVFAGVISQKLPDEIIMDSVWVSSNQIQRLVLQEESRVETPRKAVGI